MENFPSDSDLKNVVRELCEGKELAKQLQTHLDLHSSSSSSSSQSHECPEFLLQRIIYSYDHALSMLHGHGHGEVPPPTTVDDTLAGIPHSDDSDQDLPSASRKRKVAKWSEKVKVSREGGIEGQLDDGYAWRKYGQKDILGAKHPRGYYRCTYRPTYGCLATKHVQRSDEDPTTFEITYRRKHTCTKPTPDPQIHQDPYPSTLNPQNDPPSFNIQTTLKVTNITPDSGTNADPIFNFPSSSSSPINPQTNHIFSDHNNLLGNYNNYPIHMNHDFGELIPNLLHSDSELTPIVAPLTSTSPTTNSATLDMDFPFGPSGFGSGFDFGDSGHYP